MDALERLAELQIRHSVSVIVLALVATAVLAAGIPAISLETDFQASLPQDLPPIATQNLAEDRFGSTDAIVILIETNDATQEPGFITDVRDPRLITSLGLLDEELAREPLIDSTTSIATAFSTEPDSIDAVQSQLEITGLESLVNRDYTATLVLVQLSEKSTEENIQRSTRIIEENLAQTPFHPGLDITVSGLPVIRTDISRILVEDSVLTISVASLLILLLLTVMRGPVYGPITFLPLFLGLLWTLGMMGWLGIPLTIATIALGAMILGLGVEYGSFITERILEEGNSDVAAGIRAAVPTTGRSILGSSTTTIVGFGALVLSTISFIRDLGLTLALGIGLTLGAALIVTPALIMTYQRWRR